ncbi:hypothetical protein BKA80DRAFT_283853 [Phyllosticta citrichinensis]
MVACPGSVFPGLARAPEVPAVERLLDVVGVLQGEPRVGLGPPVAPGIGRGVVGWCHGCWVDPVSLSVAGDNRLARLGIGFGL